MTFIYTGAIHIHTDYSDGTRDIKHVAKMAKKAGLSWVVITDHNNLAGMEEEGFYDGVAVIVGSEISPDHGDHYLALDIKEEISCETSAQEYVDKVNEQGGFGFIAHPHENKNRQNKYPPLSWWDWETKNFTGLEIWNHLSDWVDNYEDKNCVPHYFFREHILKGPHSKVLNWWDKLNLENDHIVPAIGGCDVHCLVKKYLGFIEVKAFPYDDSFKRVSNMLYFEEELPDDDFEETKKCILDALKYGKNTIINRTWNKNGKTPLFYIQNAEKRVYSGGSLNLDDKTQLCVRLPRESKVRIIYDGQLVWEYETDYLDFDKLDKGKYRIEAYYKDKPYFFTNPIRIS